MSLDSSYLLGGRRITVGASQVVGVTSGAFNQGFVLKKISPEEHGGTFTLALVDGPSYAWNTGYVLSDYEVISVSGPATFYLAAAGVTAIIQMSRTYSVGSTGLPSQEPFIPGGLL